MKRNWVRFLMNIFAEWAPEPGDKEKVKIFMEGLEAELKSCPMETKK